MFARGKSGGDSGITEAAATAAAAAVQAMQQPLQQIVSNASARQPRQQGKVKMSQHVDQDDDTELGPPDASLATTVLRNYRWLMDGRPLDEHEPTDIQIHCLYHRLWMQGRTPYADFAVWGPYNDRTRRNNKFRTFVADGLSSYRQIELPGPENWLAWKASWGVFRVTLIGMQLVSYGILERYEKAIEEFVTEWPECWGFIAKAEDQARRDEMERIRRRADEDSAMGRDWCKDYTTARPWEFTFAQLSNPRHEYWIREVREPITTWMTRTGMKSGTPVTTADRVLGQVAPGLAVDTSRAKPHRGGGGGANAGSGATDKADAADAATKASAAAAKAGKTKLKKLKKQLKKAKKAKAVSRPPPPPPPPPAGGDGGKGKGKSKGKTPDGKPICFSWARGKGGKCANLGPNQACLGDPKREHVCEICFSPDHKTKDHKFSPMKSMKKKK